LSKAASGRGIAIYGATGITVSGNTIRQTWDAGILVGAVGGSIAGTSTLYPYQITISNNTVSGPFGNGVSTTAGIYLSFTRSVSVVGNTVYNSPTDGISVGSVGRDIKISNNDVARVTGRGIVLSQLSSTDARLLLELWTNLGDTAPTRAGISKITLANNVIRNTAAGNGISIEGESTFRTFDNVISSNEVYSAVGTFGLSGRGILSFYSNNSIITGNRVDSTSDDGIRVANSSNAVVNNNNVSNAGAVGISLVISTNSVASGNFVILSGGVGIYSDPGSSSNLVTGNQSTANSGLQVSVDNSISNTTSAFNNLGVDYAVGYGASGPLLDFPSGLYIGGSLANQLFKRIAVFTAVENPSSIPANTCSVRALSATGAGTSDVLVSVTKPTAQAGLSFTPVNIGSIGSANVNFCNNTSSPIVPTAGETYTFVVLH